MTEEHVSALYPHLLGPEWARLPESIRCAHTQGQPVSREGIFQVEVGTTLTSRAARYFLGIPSQEGLQPVTLHISPHNDQEIWSRQIGTWTLRTLQYAKNGDLIEQFERLCLEFDVSLYKNKLVYRQRRCTLHVMGLTLPVPSLLAPFVQATESEARELGGTHVEVSLSSPLTGRIVRYSGRLE